MGNHGCSRKITGFAAKDPSEVLFPYTYNLRETGVKDLYVKVICCGVCHTLYIVEQQFEAYIPPLITCLQLQTLVCISLLSPSPWDYKSNVACQLKKHFRSILEKTKAGTGTIVVVQSGTGLRESGVSKQQDKGSRLTPFELVHDNIPATIIANSAAAALMKDERVNAVTVGVDRVAANEVPDVAHLKIRSEWERHMEGRPLSPVLPSDIIHDLPAAVQTTRGAGESTWGYFHGPKQPHASRFAARPLIRPSGRPPLPNPAAQVDSWTLRKQQKTNVPVLVKHLAGQLSEQEQS